MLLFIKIIPHENREVFNLSCFLDYFKTAKTSATFLPISAGESTT
jgi:hypothetical protein